MAQTGLYFDPSTKKTVSYTNPDDYMQWANASYNIGDGQGPIAPPGGRGHNIYGKSTSTLPAGAKFLSSQLTIPGFKFNKPGLGGNAFFDADMKAQWDADPYMNTDANAQFTPYTDPTTGQTEDGLWTIPRTSLSFKDRPSGPWYDVISDFATGPASIFAAAVGAGGLLNGMSAGAGLGAEELMSSADYWAQAGGGMGVPGSAAYNPLIGGFTPASYAAGSAGGGSLATTLGSGGATAPYSTGLGSYGADAMAADVTGSVGTGMPAIGSATGAAASLPGALPYIDLANSGGAAGAASGAASAGGGLWDTVKNVNTLGGLLQGNGLAGLIPSALGAYASNQQTDALEDLAKEYMGMGAPYRSRLASLYADPNAFLSSNEVQVPVQQGTDALARALSINGNPAGSGRALQQLQSYASDQLFSRLGQEKDRLAGFGGLSAYSQAAPGASMNAIGSQSNMYGAIGGGLADLLNPPKSLAEQLFEYKKMMSDAGLSTA